MNQEYAAETVLSPRITRNALWSIGGALVSFAVTFVTIPLFISLLGDSNYGLFVLFQSVMAGFSLMGIGVGSAMVKYVSECIGRGDYSQANHFVNTTLSFNICAGAFGAIVIVLLAGPLAHHVFEISSEQQVIVQNCFYWVAIGWFITQIAITFSSIPVAFQNFKIVAIGTGLSSVMIAAVGLGVLYAGGDLVQLVQANAAALGLSVIGWWLLSRRVFGHLKVRIGVEWNSLKKTVMFGSWHTLAGMGGLMYHWLDRIIIGAFLPPAAIAYYNVPAAICSRAHGGLAQIGTIFFPLISYLQGRSDAERIYKYFINGSWVLGLFSAAGYIPLAIYGKSFLGLWISPEFAEKSGHLFTIIILAHMILSTSIIRYNFLAGVGRPNWLAAGAMLSGVIGVAALIVLIPKFGIMGAGWSYFASAVSGTLITILMKMKFFPEKAWHEILYAVYGPVITGIIIIAVHYLMLPDFVADTWSTLLFAFVVTVLSSITLLLFIDFVLFRSERRDRIVWNIIQKSIRIR